eukprot:10410208-Ditylum_brightwellii.AAC.1
MHQQDASAISICTYPFRQTGQQLEQCTCHLFGPEKDNESVYMHEKRQMPPHEMKLFRMHIGFS